MIVALYQPAGVGAYRRRRGMGETCASRGPIPPGYLCSDASGNAVITQVGAGPSTVVNVSPSGVNTVEDWFTQNVDEPLTCAEMLAAGADLTGTTCASSPLAGMPGWVIPVGVAVLAFAIFMRARR